jgi:signal transduction histidine kinase
MREDDTTRLSDDSSDLLHDIAETVTRMRQTIDRLLSLSSLTREELSHEPVSLSALVQTIVDELRRREPARQVVLNIAPDVAAVGDERLLRMALENLLENAWKYTSKCPEAVISFEVQQSDSGAQVYVVRDNGAGFDQTEATEVFQAFRRLHATSEFPGTGIGLAMVRRIIHLHGGTIWAQSARSQGAAFFFTLKAQ